VSGPVAANVADLVRDAARRAPTKAAFVFRDSTMTWADVDARVDAAAAGLRALVADRGARVAVQLGNTPDFPVVYFGALRAGFVAVPVNTGYTRTELLHALRDSGAAVLVTTRSGAADGLAMAGELEGLRAVVVADVDEAPAGATTLDSLLQTGTGTVDSLGGGEDLAVVLYTSGTSGRPRGAMLSHRALLANLDQCARIDPPVTSADDIVLLVLPLFHVYGQNAALGAVAKHAATGVLTERFDPVDTLDEIRRHGVTNVVGAPPMYVAWSMLPDVGDAFTSVRLAISGAAPLPSEVLRRVLDVTGHHVFEGYGLTETAPVLTTTLMSEVAKPDSIGRAVPGVELTLVDEQGRPVEDGDPGEIRVRGANLFSGYWPDGEGGPDADGWFGTGDIALVDDAGQLRLVGRSAELVIVNGFNVYPAEVEAVLAAQPGVAEVAVVGVEDPATGEAVRAYVVAATGATLDPDGLRAAAAASLARFKLPREIEIVAALPRTVTGKIMKWQVNRAPG
jgi:long-chain acyl-CoA synthetase